MLLKLSLYFRLVSEFKFKIEFEIFYIYLFQVFFFEAHILYYKMSSYTSICWQSNVSLA